MRRLIAIAVVGLIGIPVAGAQTPDPTPTHAIAVVLRIPMSTQIVDLERGTVVDDVWFEVLTRSLSRWRDPPLDGVPLALAVSPALCDALHLADQSQARTALSALRRVAQRAEVLTVPYADVWLPYLASDDAVAEQLTLGRAALRRCTDRDPTDTLFAHVLHTGESEPTRDVDAEAIAAARRLDVERVIAHGITQTPVRSEGVTVIPFVSVDSVGLNQDGSLREPAGMRRFVAVADAQQTDHIELIERLTESEQATLVRVPEVAAGAPHVAVAFSGDPEVPRRYRDVLARTREVVDTFAGITLPENPVLARLKIAFAEAVAATSKDAEVALELGERRDAGADLAEDVTRFVDRELARVRVSGGSVTFTSRRGTVPVAIANGASYPVRVRVSVSSSKLTFPDGRTRVVTIEPPGDTITFDAVARSTGTFPTLAVVKSRSDGDTLDQAELIVRSTATNLSALILTGGGALFLLVFLVRRFGRRRRKTERIGSE